MDTFVTKAARLNGPRDIELIERELVCGEDDIIVKNHLMGICGSDKNFYRGYLPPKTAEFRQDPKFPFLLGHESGGTVVAVGSRVADYKVGDKVMGLEPGTLVLFPQGVPHMVWNTGDIPLHMVCFYAPNADAIQYTFYEDFDF